MDLSPIGVVFLLTNHAHEVSFLVFSVEWGIAHDHHAVLEVRKAIAHFKFDRGLVGLRDGAAVLYGGLIEVHSDAFPAIESPRKEEEDARVASPHIV